jgi:hypothetical protein
LNIFVNPRRYALDKTLMEELISTLRENLRMYDHGRFSFDGRKEKENGSYRWLVGFIDRDKGESIQLNIQIKDRRWELMIHAADQQLARSFKAFVKNQGINNGLFFDEAKIHELHFAVPAELGILNQIKEALTRTIYFSATSIKVEAKAEAVSNDPLLKFSLLARNGFPSKNGQESRQVGAAQFSFANGSLTVYIQVKEGIQRNDHGPVYPLGRWFLKGFFEHLSENGAHLNIPDESKWDSLNTERRRRENLSRLVTKLLGTAQTGKIIGPLTAQDIRHQALSQAIDSVNGLDLGAHKDFHEALLLLYLEKLGDAHQEPEKAVGKKESKSRVSVFSIGELNRRELIENDKDALFGLFNSILIDREAGIKHDLVITLHDGVDKKLEQYIRGWFSETPGVIVLRVDEALKRGQEGLYSYRELLASADRHDDHKTLEVVPFLVSQQRQYDQAELRTYSRLPAHFVMDDPNLRTIWTLIVNLGFGWTVFTSNEIDTKLKSDLRTEEAA